MGEDDPVIRELSGAMVHSPDVIELRLHLAGLLADQGRYAEALRHCSEALTREGRRRRRLRSKSSSLTASGGDSSSRRHHRARLHTAFM
ncbi:hypothetical protein [Mycobacterium sp.]|uniref:hypothetical protein n=1 Tax=Mycobacterium sp. TaxID=1785 RepID=UPI003F9BC125